jgi:hypothetical protein
MIRQRSIGLQYRRSFNDLSEIENNFHNATELRA